MDTRGNLTTSDGAVADPSAEVAWATADLFYETEQFAAFMSLLLTMEDLKWAQSPAAGVDWPLISELFGRGVAVTTAHVNSIPIAEYVLRSALDHFQQAEQWRAAQGSHTWGHHEFREVFASTWLVYGLGSIGSEVATRARAFGVHVIGVRRNPSGDEPVDEMITPDQVKGLLSRCDVVVLSAPGTSTTTRLVDDEFLGMMKADSLLVNIARGAIVDEPALLRALDEGPLGRAVLDVMDVEPLPEDHPFWDHPKVTVTPHNAAGGTPRLLRAAELFSENLCRYIDGRPLLNLVTRAELES